MNNRFKITIISISIFSYLAIQAQEVKKDSIGTEEVTIVKPYTPKIKDAFKIKDNPSIGTDDIQNKIEVNYKINSVPVASTFTPSKGKAKGVSKKKKEHIYDNFASLAFGLYTTPKAEIFVHTSTNRDNDLGLHLNYLSSVNGVDNVETDTDFTDAKINLFYKQNYRDFDWKVNGGYRYQKYNWYGIHDTNLLPIATYHDLDVAHNYGDVFLGGKLTYYDSFFKAVQLDVNLFSDNNNSTETHILAKPQFQIPISSELIQTDVRLEYISGKMDKDYSGFNEIKYGFYNLGVSPTFKVLRENLTINLGANLVYSGAIESTDESKFFIYPNIHASYELIVDVMKLYASVTGDLHQQSYRNFVNENPFVSPTLNVNRTDEQYNAKFGAKGKLASNISYNVNASYKREEAKPLFILNEDLSLNASPENYQYANSFGVIFDNINTLGFFGEIVMDFSKELQFGGNVAYNSYDKDTQEKAWNLPSLEAVLFAKYQTQKWNAGANLFMVGERKDLYIDNALVNNLITNKSYIDLNLNFAYHFTNRLTAFAKANNILGTNYERYTNFKAQGIQFLAGVKYKFDL